MRVTCQVNVLIYHIYLPNNSVWINTDSTANSTANAKITVRFFAQVSRDIQKRHPVNWPSESEPPGIGQRWSFSWNALSWGVLSSLHLKRNLDTNSKNWKVWMQNPKEAEFEPPLSYTIQAANHSDYYKIRFLLPEVSCNGVLHGAF